MDSSPLQVQLFQKIKLKLPTHISLVDEVATVLDLSTDSAYRRIRAEKPLTFEELYRLCTHFKLSLDGAMNLQSDAFSFSGSLMNSSSFHFEQYLEQVVQQVTYMNSFKQKHMYYIRKDIPLFHHFHFREIAAFKHYFWEKTILQSPAFANRKFSFAAYPDELFQKGQLALSLYNKLDSTEMWNIESIISTVRQVEYYRESGLFTEKDFDTIYESLYKLVSHLEEQAAIGYKVNTSDVKQTPQGSFNMYFNEVILGDNSILAELDGSRIAFLLHTGINFMMTRDISFCNNMHVYVENLMRKSTLISSVSERERSVFFRDIRNRIDAIKKV